MADRVFVSKGFRGSFTLSVQMTWTFGLTVCSLSCDLCPGNYVIAKTTRSLRPYLAYAHKAFDIQGNRVCGICANVTIIFIQENGSCGLEISCPVIISRVASQLAPFYMIEQIHNKLRLSSI